ncbi:hypothetical protein RHSIM_Rhsim06G0143600 [Rhododendron simsii]|uniref:tRNA-uridine aminocarboxypropyltransferase n=1 Tax=Rhododendron simsii TaxID=118357 RepID=A0A834GT40_RHOSS|nr:hypothetical protein RHSIM_Rhsim06G0143600 [Rhododendron simsii]
MLATVRAVSSKCSPVPCPTFRSKTHMDSPPKTLSSCTFPRSSSLSSPMQVEREGNGGDSSSVITLQEWQDWGTASPFPAMVAEIVEELRGLERDMDGQMSFGGLGGKIKGDFKVHEDKKHRAKYQALDDSEKKMQFFSARQIACRLLGSRYYLCQKCWLALEDCMCTKVVPFSLCHGIRFWLYMHPKDFLRQNNTGKLLWQVFGVQSATLCIYGIAEHEEIMWNAFKLAGKEKVWCLYPNKNAPTQSVYDAFGQDSSTSPQCILNVTNEEKPLNFVLLDGTWNNSAAMFRRLKDKANEVWGEDLPCISLATGASAMHKLRPQPSWDRTCTAAAAVGLLDELHSLQELSTLGFDKQAEALEDALGALLDALTTRRVRMGRSITRRERHNRDIC